MQNAPPIEFILKVKRNSAVSLLGLDSGPVSFGYLSVQSQHSSLSEGTDRGRREPHFTCYLEPSGSWST